MKAYFEFSFCFQFRVHQRPTPFKMKILVSMRSETDRKNFCAALMLITSIASSLFPNNGSVYEAAKKLTPTNKKLT